MRARNVALAALLLVGCSGSEQNAEPASSAKPERGKVSRILMGNDWPFTVDHGIVACQRPGTSVVFTAEGKTYAVNGTARSLTKHPDIDPIWAANPDVKGLKQNIGPIIELGLELCES